MVEGDEVDESIKCECGNDRFWWFGEITRCPGCYNEYMFDENNLEHWMRRFNKEANSYPENWEHFNPRASRADKFDEFVKELRKIHPYIVPNSEVPSFRSHIEKLVESGELTWEAHKRIMEDNENMSESFQQISDKGLESLSKDDSIVENAVVFSSPRTGMSKSIIESTETTRGKAGYVDKMSRHKFWNDRAKFKNRLERFIEFKEGIKFYLNHTTRF